VASWFGAISAAHAAPCPPSAKLSGDPKLVADVTTVLDQRGIPVLACASVSVDLERNGDGLAVAIDGRAPRTVGDSRTAATMIESWVRTDVDGPLLGVRPIIAVAEQAPPPVLHEVMVPSTWRGASVFALGQTAMASDGTGWLGAEVGACVNLGPMCAAARLRFARVAGGPGPFEFMLDRTGVELLIGGDIPVSVGKMTLSPGFSGGVGTVVTHVADMQDGSHRGSEIGGMRADVHCSLLYPLSHRFAAELALSLDFTQATHVETYSPTVEFPDVPLFLARISFGIRYGGL
jgi:hypothetical protein